MVIVKRLSFFVLLALIGCETGSGSLLVHWEISGQSCASAEVEQVVIHLFSLGQDQVEPVSTACTNGDRGVLIQNIPAGTYDVTVEGIHKSGKARYEGTQAGVSIDAGGQTTTTKIKLLARKASLRLWWVFENGKTCALNKVETVEVAAFDVGSPDIVYPPPGSNGLFPCNPLGPEYPEGIVTIEPLQGNRDLELSIFGRDPSGKRVVYDRPRVRTIPGEATDVEAVLRPCTGNACL